MKTVPRYPEFFQSPFVGVYLLRDVEGRPLGEDNCPPSYLAEIETEWRVCPYRDSRSQHPKPMNVSALRQVTAHWDDIASGILWLRRLYAAPYRLEAFSLSHTWKFARMCTALPRFLLARRNNALQDGQVPLDVAGIYKTVSGILMTVEHMLARGMSGESVLSSEAFVEYTNAQGIFEGPHGVCAAPPHLLLKAVATVLEGGSSSGDAGDARLRELLPDVDCFLRFAARATQLDLAKQLFRLRSLCVHARLASAVENLSFSTPAAIAAREVVARSFTLATSKGAFFAPLLVPAAAAHLAGLLEYLPSESAMLGAFDEGETTAGSIEWPADSTAAPDDVVTRTLNGTREGADALPVELRSLVLRAAAETVRLERSALASFTALHARVDASVGRACSEQPLGHADLLDLIGETPIEIARTLGLLPENSLLPATV